MFETLSPEKILSLWFAVAMIFSLSDFPSRVFAQTENQPQTSLYSKDEIDREYRRLLDTGLSYFIEGNYPKAAGFFQEAIRLKPREAAAKKALKSVKIKIKEMNLDQVEIGKEEVEKAKGYYRDRQYLLAVVTLRPVLDQDPGHRDAKRIMSKVSGDMRDLLKKEDPHSYEWLAHQGIESYIKGKFEHAMLCWKRAVSKKPDDQIMVLTLEQTEGYMKLHPELKGQSAGEVCVCEVVEETASSADEKKEESGVKVKPFILEDSSSKDRTSALPPGKKPKETSMVLTPSAPLVLPPVSAAPAAPPVEEEPKVKPASVRPKQKTEEKNAAIDKGKEKAERIHAKEAVIEPTFAAKPEPPPPAPKRENEVESIAEMKSEPKTELSAMTLPPSVSNEPPELIKAKALLSKNDYAGSISILDQYLKENPANLQAKELMAQIIVKQREAAAKHFEAGLAAYADGENSKALDEWQAVLKIYPEHPTAKKMILRTFFQDK